MKIAVLGMGVVGGGVVQTLKEHECGIEVTRILDKRPLEYMEELRTQNIEDILCDDEIEAVVETMGGVKPAYAFVLAALRAKKHVVSSNKQLISAYFRELHEAAAQNGVLLRYTAAAGGGIPWLFNLARARRCDDIVQMEGVINGTTNFILDSMYTSGASFEESLKEAQRLGYAEADPSADIDGLDTRRKCAISASIGFDGFMDEAEIPCFGIRSIKSEDIAFCKKEERVCRLMFSARKSEKGVCACVLPVFVQKGAMEASIHGCENIVSLQAKLLGDFSMIGQGAGGAPTGIAVVQDLIDVAAGVHKHAPSLAKLPLTRCERPCRYYIRKDGRQYISKPMSVEEALREGADFLAQIKE